MGLFTCKIYFQGSFSLAIFLSLFLYFSIKNFLSTANGRCDIGSSAETTQITFPHVIPFLRAEKYSTTNVFFCENNEQKTRNPLYLLPFFLFPFSFFLFPLFFFFRSQLIVHSSVFVVVWDGAGAAAADRAFPPFGVDPCE